MIAGFHGHLIEQLAQVAPLRTRERRARGARAMERLNILPSRIADDFPIIAAAQYARDFATQRALDTELWEQNRGIRRAVQDLQRRTLAIQFACISSQ